MAATRILETAIGRVLAGWLIPTTDTAKPTSQPTPTDGVALAFVQVDTSGNPVGGLPTTIYSAQQTVTGAAAALASSGSLVNGVIVKAGSTNANPVYVGPSGVTSSTGYRLNAGEAISYAVANASGVYIIGTAGTDVVYVTGN